MKIRIISVGKVKDKNLDILIEKYIKKINHYICCERILIKEENIFDNPSNEQQNIILKNEAKNFQRFIHDSYNIATVIESKQMSSIDFSKKINNLIKGPYKNINFFIGSSFGLDKSFINQMDECISFSYFTFTHQMFQLIISEQIYRSFTILNNITYHK